MNRPFFTGVCTALVTPFLEGKVNYPMMETLLRRQLEAGVKAVVIAGTTGEAPTLSDEEKLTLFKRCKTFVGNEMKIIAGTGSNSTEHSVILSRRAEECGADGLLVVSPYYNKATADGLIAHYSTIAEAVTIPMILYNVPSRTGMDIPVAVYEALSKSSNIVGVKEASNDITKFTKIRYACGPGFAVWSGNDEMTVPTVALGGKGVISVASNLIPEEMGLLTEAALDGDFDTAADLQTRLQPLMEALFSQVNPIPVKEAMHLIGYDCGPCRLPLTAASEAVKMRLKELLT